MRPAPCAPRLVGVRRRTVQGRVVLVTGASAGIGRAVSERLAAKGALVVACARGEERLRAFAAGSPNITAVRADVSRSEDRAALVHAALAAHGRIDALVNNAGLGWTGLVEDMPAEKIDQLFETNAVAVVDLTRRVLPHLLARRDGDVVTVSSAAAWNALPPLTVYAATKFAVEGFTRGLRREVWARGVRVHSVNPGPVRTEWLARAGDYSPAEGQDARMRRSYGVPPEWVAAAVERALVSPWPRTASVPRVVGLGRVLEVAPISTVLDAAMSWRAESIGRWGARSAQRRAAPRDRAVDLTEPGAARPGP